MEDKWYCECCQRTDVEEIVCIEAEVIKFSTSESAKMFEHYFCEKCFKEILNLIENKSCLE